MFKDIGRRLRAHRLGTGQSADSLADALAVSRAQIYRIEAGEIIKIETLERLAGVLETSVPSLLGVCLEYYAKAVTFFERMKQIEEDSDQVIAHFPTVSYLLSSDDYPRYLHQMLVESVYSDFDERASQEIETIIEVLNERKAAQKRRHLSVINFVSIPEVEKLLQLGLVGRLDLPEDEKVQRRIAARSEIEHLLRLIEDGPMGIQVALIEDILPNINFQIFKGANQTMLGLSPFRLGGELPNIRLGVATVTADAEPVRLYEGIVEDLWRRSHKGAEASALLRSVLDRSNEFVERKEARLSA